MTPTLPMNPMQPTDTDDAPRYFLDDRYDAGIDGDWWLDLGSVDLPVVPGV